jgi:hypothetical protein
MDCKLTINPEGEAEQAIRCVFANYGNHAVIPLMTVKVFRATLVDGGVEVDNLRGAKLLSWQVFEETLCLLKREGGRALRGNAMAWRLGEPGLPLNSIEGHIARTIYGKHPGDTVFRRISPITAIMVWAGLCKPGKAELILRDGVLNNSSKYIKIVNPKC